MTLLDDMRLILRVTSSAYDSEVEMLINAAISDMLRLGIKQSAIDGMLSFASEVQGKSEKEAALLRQSASLAKQAVACYCKANFGYDNDEASRFDKMYRMTVTDLIHSQAYEPHGEQ